MTQRVRILIIDDERAIVNGLAFRIRAAGKEALAAYDGRSGLATARQESPNLILLDRRLPDADGLSVLATLKSLNETSQIPVVMISGCESDCQEALDAGAAAFLSKPYRGDEFEDLVTRLTTDRPAKGR